MSRIYGLAHSVCIWIGESDEHSKMAFDFIKDEVLRLQKFDELCESENAGPKWRALLNVMKRPWFSRRWVIQEIALARQATIYCGEETISWKDFSDAVQLFVEVESATHRLSDVMKKDPDFFHIPGWFEYVSALGASLLVEATGTLFRKSKTQRLDPLLSLELLVSRMAVFQATVSHDTIYSLLAIAKDTAPTPVIRETNSVSTKAHPGVMDWMNRHARARQYHVDYQQPLVDVCQQFIDFCIHQSDKGRALDIICRPWAPVLEDNWRKQKRKKSVRSPRYIQVNEEFSKMPSWIPTLAGAANAMYEHANGELKMGRMNADPLVGLPEYVQRNYSAAGTMPLDMLSLRFKKRADHYSMFVYGFLCDEVQEVEMPSQSGNIPREWIEDLGGWEDLEDDPPEELWRTLVADRGKHGRNPPTYYARACKESINKGLRSGSLNTTELINDGRCSVVAEFFRRVQAVIWNRSLMRTKNKALGLVGKNAQQGDLICVLYGCSVPVILRKHVKPTNEIIAEHQELKTEQESASKKLEDIYLEHKARKKKHKEARLRRVKTDLSTSTDRDYVVAESLSSMNGDTDTPLENEIPPDDTELTPMPTSTRQDRIKSRRDRFREPIADVTAVPAQRHVWFEFIGECYVHGMMDGEAIEKQNNEKLPRQLFELR